MITVLFMSISSGGIPTKVELASGSTVGHLLAKQNVSGDYAVSVNGVPKEMNDPLSDGDRVAITHKKVKGATA